MELLLVLYFFAILIKEETIMNSLPLFLLIYHVNLFMFLLIINFFPIDLVRGYNQNILYLRCY